jgi:hypothetical protein
VLAGPEVFVPLDFKVHDLLTPLLFLHNPLPGTWERKEEERRFEDKRISLG